MQPCVACRAPTDVDTFTLNNVTWARAWHGHWPALGEVRLAVMCRTCWEQRYHSRLEFATWLAVVGPVFNWDATEDAENRLGENGNVPDARTIADVVNMAMTLKPGDNNFDALARLVCKHWASGDESCTIYGLM